MKINGGKYRGKKLVSPQSKFVRPTSDRMREAVFNILRSRLGFDFKEKVFFDMFCGSGAMGLEAMSQGFGKIYFFDKDTVPLQNNLKFFTNEISKMKVVCGDVAKALEQEDLADVVFMDAPYQKCLSEPLLEYLVKGNFFKKNALCLIEIEKNEKCELPTQLVLIDERKYGMARLIIAKFTD